MFKIKRIISMVTGLVLMCFIMAGLVFYEEVRAASNEANGDGAGQYTGDGRDIRDQQTYVEFYDENHVLVYREIVDNQCYDWANWQYNKVYDLTTRVSSELLDRICYVRVLIPFSYVKDNSNNVKVTCNPKDMPEQVWQYDAVEDWYMGKYGLRDGEFGDTSWYAQCVIPRWGRRYPWARSFDGTRVVNYKEKMLEEIYDSDLEGDRTWRTGYMYWVGTFDTWSGKLSQAAISDSSVSYAEFLANCGNHVYNFIDGEGNNVNIRQTWELLPGTGVADVCSRAPVENYHIASAYVPISGAGNIDILGYVGTPRKADYAGGQSFSVIETSFTVFHLGEQLLFDPNGGTIDGIAAPASRRVKGDRTDIVGSKPSEWTMANGSLILEGWYTLPVGGERVYDGNGAKVLNPGATVGWNENGLWAGGGVTLYAHWTDRIYTTNLTFHPNGGTLPNPGGNLYVENPQNIESAKQGSANVLTVQYDRPYFNLMGGDIPTRVGYTFGGWYSRPDGGIIVYDLYGNAVSGWWSADGAAGKWNKTDENLTVYAGWMPRADTPYMVKHWQQNISGGSEQNSVNYTMVEKEDFKGTTDSSVTPAVRSYAGFTSPSAQTVTIKADGTTVVNYYYTRNSYTVTLSCGNGVDSVSGGGTYRYGAEVKIDAVVKSGYVWSAWGGTYSTAVKNYSFTMPAGNVAMIANADIVVYKITYELNGGSVVGNPSSYTVETPTFALYNPTRTGYSFAGWTGTGLAQPSTSVMILRGSTGNRHYVANWVDDIAPVISVSPEGSGGAYRQNMDIVISISEKGTGLAADNSYEFFVSSVANPTSSVGLRAYTSGVTVNIGDSLNGKYYVFVKAVKDNAGNVSSRDGIMVDIDGVMYHRFGLYLFDNVKPMVMLEQEHSRGSVNVVLTIELLDPGTEASGISSSSNLVYYVSDSSTMLRNGSFKNYVSGVPFEVGEGMDLTKKWYIFIECVEDNAGNISVNEGTIVSYGGKDYHCFGPLSLDSEPPVVEVSPESAFNVQSVEVVIEWTETGSGLASDNVYEYYLSDNPDVLTGGVWTPYISGVGFSIGHGLDGNKYLFIKRVSDIAGNISEEKGDLKTIGGDTYHRFGPYGFDNTPPEGVAKYIENEFTLGIDNNGAAPFAVMDLPSVTDDVSGVDSVILTVYDVENPANSMDFALNNEDEHYFINFTLYGCLNDYANIKRVGMKITATDAAGNSALLPIDEREWGYTQTLAVRGDGTVHFEKDSNDNVYYRDSFRAEGRIYSIRNDLQFLSGELATLHIYTFGYVESVSAAFPSLELFYNPLYDDLISLGVTDIGAEVYEEYIHSFYVPLYTPVALFQDNTCTGYKKGLSQTDTLLMDVSGSILDLIHTIIK